MIIYHMNKNMTKDLLEDYDFDDVLLALGIRKISDINNTEKLKELSKKIGNKYIGISLANIQDSIKLYGFEILTLKKEKEMLLDNKSLEEIDEETKKQIEIIDNKIQIVTEKQKQSYDKKDNFHKTTELQMNEYLAQIDSLENKLSNNLQILYQLMILKYNLIKQLEIKKKNENLHEMDSTNEANVSNEEESSLEEKEIISALCHMLNTQDEFFTFMLNCLEIVQKTDWRERNLSSKSRFRYDRIENYDNYYNHYIIAPNKSPEQLLDCKIDGEDIHVLDEQEDLVKYEKQRYDERIRVYNIGTFRYSVYSSPPERGLMAQIISVCKEDKDGNLKIYNGVISDINKNYIIDDPEFYVKVVFSDLVMQNAEKNNYGYIGNVNNEDNGKKLIYKAICLDELMENLYVANHVENGQMMNKSLPAFYSHMDNIITMQIEKEKQLEQNKRGGR